MFAAPNVTLGVGALLIGIASPLAAAQTAAPSPAWREFHEAVQPFFARYCYDCHGEKKAENDLRLDLIRDAASLKTNDENLEKALKYLVSHKMPPADEPQPTAAEQTPVVKWLKSYLAGGPDTPINPGRVTARRLNRAEYNNTIRDLLGVALRPADGFPVDDSGYGFDNNGDVLSLAPMLLEKYLNAATAAVGAARQANQLPRAEPGHPKLETAEKNLRRFAARAYRRPVSDDEMKELLALWTKIDADGRPFEQSYDVVLRAILISPAFLFRVELEPQPGETAGVHTLNDYELATRLSYFLWSSMPDGELFALAEKGTLRAALSVQVRRMLKDPKQSALVENFAGQWLQLRMMPNVAPNKTQFPGFDPALRRAMVQETELFFSGIVQEDRSVLDFIDAEYTYVNARLAAHYGMTGITGDNFRRVTLTDGRRGGVLTQASILTLTSPPNRTSPVQRGKWVLENLLGHAPPPPPPNVPPFPETKGEAKGTLRQRLEQHRADPACASCHAQMDGIGFALENFDAIGAWRTNDGPEAIDASGTLPGGKTFNGPAELRRIIQSQSDEFLNCFADRMLTFALGRGLESYDRRTTDNITEAMKAHGQKFSALIDAIVRSEPFQKRNGREK